MELLEYDIKFETQHPVGKYKLDIALPEYMMALELDGHDYHTNPQQRARDEMRDKYLTEVQGWRVERVQGWFAFRYPMATVVKMLRHIPVFHEHPRYKLGENQMLDWYVKDLMNTGDGKEAERILDEYGN